MYLYPTFWTKFTEGGYHFLESFTNQQNLSFTTQLNGGFGTASLDILGPRGLSFERYRKFLGAHAVFFDSQGRRAYEGRVNDTILRPEGVSIRVEGYFSYGSECIQGQIYVTSPTTNYQVIKDCIDITDNDTWINKYAMCDQAADVDVCTFDGRDYSMSKINEVLDEVLKLGYKESDARRVYFAIWDHRAPYFFVEPSLRKPKWFIEPQFLQESFNLSQSRSEIWNSINGVYESSTGPDFHPSAPVENETSKDIYGEREAIINVGQTSQAHAGSLQDAALDTHTWPRQSFQITVQGIVRHQAGFLEQPYRIRAGDVILLTGLDPYVANVGVPGGDGEGGGGAAAASGLAGIVMSTTYQEDSNSCKIVVNTKDTLLTTLIARLGISGGLS